MEGGLLPAGTDPDDDSVRPGNDLMYESADAHQMCGAIFYKSARKYERLRKYT